MGEEVAKLGTGNSEVKRSNRLNCHKLRGIIVKQPLRSLICLNLHEISSRNYRDDVCRGRSQRLWGSYKSSRDQHYVRRYSLCVRAVGNAAYVSERPLDHRAFGRPGRRICRL